MLYLLSLFTKSDHLNKHNSAAIFPNLFTQVIHHKKAEWISFQTNINVRDKQQQARYESTRYYHELCHNEKA